MKTKAIFGAILACCLAFANCTEPPPLPPGTETKPPVETKPPGETGTPPATLKLAGQMSLPREIHALFVDGDTSYACTPEGSLYNVQVKDMRRFQIAAVDLASGKQKWQYSGSACVFRGAGESLFVVRDLTKTTNQVVIDRLNAKTGEVEATIKAAHSGCVDQEKSGVGEKMFATESEQKYSCFDISIHNNRLLFSNQHSVQLFDATNGQSLWSQQVKSEEGRFVSAANDNNAIFVFEAVSKLAEGATAPPSASPGNTTGFAYQVRAVDMTSGQDLWAVGPFFAPVLSARLTIQDGALVVQAMSSSLSSKVKEGELLSFYAKANWSANVRTYSFDTATGRSLWKLPSQTVFQKYAEQPIPTLPAPVSLQDGLLLQVPGILKMVSADHGIDQWLFGTKDPMISHTHAISSEHVHLRTSDGKSTLLKLIPKKTPEVTSGGDIGSLLYAAGDAIAPDAEPAKTSQGPTKRFSATAYCVKINGKHVPLRDMKQTHRFFLPPPSSYGGGANSFFNEFCASFLIDVEAFEFGGKSLWRSRAVIAEAPVFYFVRQHRLFAISDNGDWYQFQLQ